MAISVGGIISGMDTESIISQLLTLEAKPILNLQQKEADFQVELTAYGSLRSVLGSLKSAAEGLDTTTELTGFTAASSDTDLVTVTATSSATAGTHNITVDQLAQVHKLKSTGFTETEEIIQFSIDATNNKIDFKEDIGGGLSAELTATISSGNYTVSELETEIETQLEAATANAVQYTVSYSSSTEKFSIQENGSTLTELQLLWNTGTNSATSAAATIGFDNAADDTAANEYTADNTAGEGTIHLEIGNVFTINANNKYIDFEEDNNLRLATITEGNYTVSELEAEIKNQLESAVGGVGTYTVSYDNSTQKFTINASAGVTDLDLLWKTGTHGADNAGDSAASLLGFNAEDDEGGGSHTGDNTVGTVYDISISASDTIEDIADAINDADAGVTATVIYDGAQYFLTLSGDESGDANVINLMVTDADGDNTDANGLSRLVYHKGGTENLTETQAAADAIFDFDGVETIHRDSNTIDDLIDGLTITLLSEPGAPDNEATLTVSRKTSTAVSKINSFVSAYNTVLDFFESYQGYDEETELAGPLQGDATTNQIRNRLRNLTSQMVTGVTSFSWLSDLGIELDAEGDLTADSSTLNSALDDNFDDVLQFFTQTTEGAEGFAVRMVDAVEGFLDSYDGTLTSRTSGIQGNIDDIEDDVERLTRRLEASEIRMRSRFQSLELLLGQYQTTSDFLGQQISALKNLGNYISNR